MLSIARYAVKNQCLAPWIKFIWYFEAKEADIHYKLLPTDCLDIILNLSGTIIYDNTSQSIFPSPFHVNSLRSEHSYIHHTGNVRVFGISCYAYGLYPFIHQSLAGIHNRVVDLSELSSSLTRDLSLAVFKEDTPEQIIQNIEKSLCLNLQATEEEINKTTLIHDFLMADCDLSIQSFCTDHSIHPKTFTRNVIYYTGCTPKTLRLANRFQKVGNQLVHQSSTPFSEMAYDNNFADQAHFIRTFRKFSGATPRIFQQEKVTIKENVKYHYR